ncbi:hypothetical protein ACWIID_38475 [Streptomyces phaeochromogenes]
MKRPTGETLGRSGAVVSTMTSKLHQHEPGHVSTTIAGADEETAVTPERRPVFTTRGK